METAEPKEWAKAVRAVRLKDRAERLQEIQRMRTSYEDTFSWEKQCEALVQNMWRIVYGKTFIGGVVCSLGPISIHFTGDIS